MSHMSHTGRPLVRVRGDTQNIVLSDIAVDPYLLIHNYTALQLSRLVDRDAALGYLGHRILGKPTDLRAHVQRILLLVNDGDGAALYSALLDLMISLGASGRALKQHMLRLAEPLLAHATVAFFREHLDRGVTPADPQARRGKGSLLRVSHVAGMPLVARTGGQSSQLVTVMEQANSLLEYGQLEQAVELLENALLQDPDQESEAELLLGLYRLLREEARWHGMCEQLQINFNRLPVAWAKKPEHF